MSQAQNYLQTVIENGGQACGNCGVWRILKPETQDNGLPWHNSIAAGEPRIIEQCYKCKDDAFDIYEAAEDCP